MLHAASACDRLDVLEEEAKLSNHPVMLFVHGTWSNPSVWDKLESYLANSDEIPKSVAFRRVKWSGGNSAFARSEGITEFEKIAAEYAERPLHVVSHSHGANVVLASSEKIRKRVKFLICLNSPIITTLKGKVPWPVWMVLGLIVAMGLFAGLLILKNMQVAWASLSIATCVLLFLAARSRFAFLLLPLFPIVAIWLLHNGLVEWSISQTTHPLWFSLTVSVLILVPVLAIYAFWTKKYARDLNPKTVEHLVQILTVDDEIFTLLGFGLATQRAIQFILWPLDVFFGFNWVFVLMSSGLMALTIFERLFPSLKNIHAGYMSYVEAPLVMACLIWAALILVKFLLLGIGYGWDMAGLSLSHAIYISAGSFKQETEIYTLMPRNERKFWVSHVAIHERDDVCEKVEELLKVSLGEEN
jgi:pimeloyl-ACP methyl ester carboxylesterase